MDHHRQAEGLGRRLGAPQRLEIVGAGDVVRQSRLDADDEVAMAPDRPARQTDVGMAEVMQFAAGRDAGSGDIDQEAAHVRQRGRVGDPLVDAVGSERSRVDPCGHAVREGDRRTAAAGMGVDVDQARRHVLAARIDRFGGVAGDVGLDRRDAAAGDRDVADLVDPQRGIDDVPALDDEIIGRGEQVGRCGRAPRRPRRSQGRNCVGSSWSFPPDFLQRWKDRVGRSFAPQGRRVRRPRRRPGL